MRPKTQAKLKLISLVVAGLACAKPAFAQLDTIASSDIRAQLIAQRYATLSSELQANISKLQVREGQAFKQGQTLVELDCRLQQSQFDKAQAQAEAARNVLKGNQKLFELKSIGEIELQNASAEVNKTNADVAYYQTVLDKCSLKAPYDGYAGEIKARELEFVQPGQPLLEIIDTKNLELEFIVPTRWLAWIQKNYRFTIDVEDSGKSYPAEVSRISPKADPVSQSVKVIARILGTYTELMPGMSAKVLILPPTHPNRKLISKPTAIQTH